MERPGSVSVFALLIMSVILINSLFVLSIVTLQNHIALSSTTKIQSNILAKDKINRLFYEKDNFDKYLKPKIIKNCRRTSYPKEIDLDDDHELKKYINKTEIIMEERNNRKNMFINISTNYKGMSNYSSSYGPIINIIFEINRGYISEREIDDVIEYREEFYKLMDIIEKEIYDYDCNPTSSVKRINTNGNIKISNDFIRKKRNRTGEDNSYYEILSDYKHKHILLNIKDDEDEKAILELGEVEDGKTILLRGTLYIEGDLIINQNFEFEGIMILNNGNIIVNSSNSPIIRGMILHKGYNELDMEMLKIMPNQKYIYGYGSYLPGFIDPEIKVIKNY